MQNKNYVLYAVNKLGEMYALYYVTLPIKLEILYL